jgi:hypothetical protein
MLATGAQAAPKKIKTQDAFLNAVAGKTLVGNDGTKIVIKADGTYSGANPKFKFQGAWTWSGKHWCRSLYVNGDKKEDDCQAMAIEDGKLFITRNKGKGAQQTWSIK